MSSGVGVGVEGVGQVWGRDVGVRESLSFPRITFTHFMSPSVCHVSSCPFLPNISLPPSFLFFSPALPLPLPSLTLPSSLTPPSLSLIPALPPLSLPVRAAVGSPRSSRTPLVAALRLEFPFFFHLIKEYPSPEGKIMPSLRLR